MRGLAQGEILGNEPNFFEKCLSQSFDRSDSAYTKDDYIALAIRGGYPEALRIEDLHDRQDWYREYKETLIDRDLVEIVNIRRAGSLRDLSDILAAWSSKLMNLQEIQSTLGLSRPTLESYMNILEMLFVVERVSPWFKTDYERVGRQDKLFYTDTGLMSSLLKYSPSEIRLDGDRVGKLIETYVFNQLSAIVDVQEGHYHISHYRDREKREVDFIIETPTGHCIGIEVKASSSISKDNFKELQWFRDHVIPGKSFIGLVLYTGQKSILVSEGLWAVPISQLFG